MKATVKIDDNQIQKMDLSITVTMSVQDWRELMRQTPENGWPGWAFGNAIATALGHLKNSTDTVLEIKP